MGPEYGHRNDGGIGSGVNGVSAYRGFRCSSRDVCNFWVHGDTMASVGLIKYCLEEREN